MSIVTTSESDEEGRAKGREEGEVGNFAFLFPSVQGAVHQAGDLPRRTRIEGRHVTTTLNESKEGKQTPTCNNASANSSCPSQRTETIPPVSPSLPVRLTRFTWSRKAPP